MRKKITYILAFFAFSTLCLEAQITIDSIIPSPACAGSVMSVYGNGMNSVNSVTVGGQAAAITGATNGQLIASIPSVFPASGMQTVTVTDGSTSASGTINIDYLDASFTYTNNHICKNQGGVLPNTISSVGGTFSTTTGLTINAQTGAIDTDNSTPGNYVITYSLNSANGCTFPSTQNIFLEDVPAMSMFFLKDTYCKNSPFDSPVVQGGDSTGFFDFNYLGSSGPKSIVWISNLAGIVNFGLSDTGLYEIVYTVPGFCPREAKDTILILENEDAGFAYDTNVYCQGNPNPSPILSGISPGVFAEPIGNIVFADSVTGEIDLNASIPGGPYFITYTVPGTCPGNETHFLTIYSDTSFCSVGIKEIEDQNQVLVYPNPAKDKVFVNFSEKIKGEVKLELISILGESVYRAKHNAENIIEIPLGMIAPGLFFLKITTAKRSFVRKLTRVSIF